MEVTNILGVSLDPDDDVIAREPQLAEPAMHDEVDVLNEKVWHAVPIQDALSEQGAKVIGTRWVVNNKGGANAP